MLRFFIAWKRRRLRATLRRRLRACRRLAGSERPFIALASGDVITGVALPLSAADFPRVLAGRDAERGEILVRQILLHRIGFQALIGAALDEIADGRRIAFPLPAVWIDALEGEGFRFSRWRCAVALHALAARELLMGWGALARRLVRRWHPPAGAPRPQAAFASLTPTCLPKASPAGFDLISWYRRSPLANGERGPIWAEIDGTRLPQGAGDDVVVVPSILPVPMGGALARFALHAVAAGLAATWGVMRGRWWQGLMLREAIQRIQLNNLPDAWLTRQVYVHGSNYVLRPLWTYEAERRGTAVSLLFYSTNSGRMHVDGRHWTPYGIGYHSMSWGRLIAWDEGHAALLRRFSPSAEIVVAGAVSFNDSPAPLPAARRPSVALFDVQVFRPRVMAGVGLPFCYYTPETVERFLLTVVEAAEAAGATILWKTKRDTGRLTHGRYARLHRALLERPSVVVIDPAISAWRVIEQADAVISIPFTSTALIAHGLNRPSAYFDASGTLGFDPESAHGLPLLRQPDEVRRWIAAAIPAASHKSTPCA